MEYVYLFFEITKMQIKIPLNFINVVVCLAIFIPATLAQLKSQH